MTGKAGCGKSHLIKTIYHSVTKTLSYRGNEPDKPRVMLLAPTGIAAINIGGNTIHSALHIPINVYGKTVPKLSDKVRSSLRNKLSELRLLVIDEVSMVGNKLLTYIDQRLVEILGCSSELAFGGISIIFSGDFHQLPPIKAAQIFALYHGDDAMQNIDPLWRMFQMAELDEVMRQKGDNILIDLLNKVRIGELDVDSENILKSRFINQNDPNYPIDAIHIFAENKPANRHNENMLNTNENVLYTIPAVDGIPKNVSQAQINRALNKNQSETGGLAAILMLKVNARVMLTSNIDIEDRLINGQIGTVKRVVMNIENKVAKIYIKFDDSKAGIDALNKDNYGKRNGLVPIETICVSIKLKTNKPSSPVIKRTQFPLMLAWACTVHKVQGLSLEQAVINFDLEKQRGFNCGQMYVALSRVTTINGMYLTGNYKANAIKADSKVTDEYERLRNNSVLQPVKSISPINNDSLTITLLNTRSLGKHAIDISADDGLCNSDILALTETQLLPHQNNNVFEENYLGNFTIMYNNSTDMFQSLAICFNSSINLNHSIHSQGISQVLLTKSTFCGIPIKFLLLYRKQAWTVPSFIDGLSQLLYDDIDIIMGDFNIDAFQQNEYLALALRNYELIIKSPTHLSGSQLDHVYIKKSLLEHVHVETIIHTVHFSDHDAVRFKLRKRTDR